MKYTFLEDYRISSAGDYVKKGMSATRTSDETFEDTAKSMQQYFCT